MVPFRSWCAMQDRRREARVAQSSWGYDPWFAKKTVKLYCQRPTSETTAKSQCKWNSFTLLLLYFPLVGSSLGSPDLHFGPSWRLEMEDWPAQTILA